MDKFSRRFLWLASQMLRDCRLDDKAEQAELDDIVRRLEEMADSAVNTNGKIIRPEVRDR
jgi:hypothetical protein